MVEQADQILKYFVASTFTAHVPLLCLLMYNLLDMAQRLTYRLYGLYWMLMVMVQSLTVAVAATMVNTQVRLPWLQVKVDGTEPHSACDSQHGQRTGELAMVT